MVDGRNKTAMKNWIHFMILFQWELTISTRMSWLTRSILPYYHLGIIQVSHLKKRWNTSKLSVLGAMQVEIYRVFQWVCRTIKGGGWRSTHCAKKYCLTTLHPADGEISGITCLTLHTLNLIIRHHFHMVPITSTPGQIGVAHFGGLLAPPIQRTKFLAWPVSYSTHLTWSFGTIFTWYLSHLP